MNIELVTTESFLLRETQQAVPSSLTHSFALWLLHSLVLWAFLFKDILFHTYYRFINIKLRVNSPIAWAWTELEWFMYSLCQACASPQPYPPELRNTRRNIITVLGSLSNRKVSKTHSTRCSTWKGHMCGMRAETRLMLSGPSTLHKLTKLSASQNARMVDGSFWVAISDGILCLVSVL